MKDKAPSLIKRCWAMLRRPSAKISLLALLFAVLIVIEVGIQQRIVMPGFAELERDDARTSMRRVDYALKMTLDSLALTAADWGNWADVYQFVQSPNAEFVAANVTPVAMKQLQINGLMIIDRDGHLILATARDRVAFPSR